MASRGVERYILECTLGDPVSNRKKYAEEQSHLRAWSLWNGIRQHVMSQHELKEYWSGDNGWKQLKTGEDPVVGQYKKNKLPNKMKRKSLTYYSGSDYLNLNLLRESQDSRYSGSRLLF